MRGSHIAGSIGNDIGFANNSMLFPQRGNDMHNKMDDNVSKTNSMAVNTERTSGSIVPDEEVEKVDTFQYLGSQIAPGGGTNLDISTRIKKVKGAFAEHRGVSWPCGD